MLFTQQKQLFKSKLVFLWTMVFDIDYASSKSTCQTIIGTDANNYVIVTPASPQVRERREVMCKALTQLLTPMPITKHKHASSCIQRYFCFQCSSSNIPKIKQGLHYETKYNENQIKIAVLGKENLSLETIQNTSSFNSIQRNISSKTRHDPNTVLTLTAETVLKNWIFGCSRNGFP